MSTYAIGDIHGCLTALKTVFDQNVIKPDDTVVFLGDYTDRGPDSKGVLDWLISNTSKFNFEFLMGNHDIMMLESRQDRGYMIDWLNSGGYATLTSYGFDIERTGIPDDWMRVIDSAHWNLLEQCKPYFEFGTFIFVHAGLTPGVPLDQQDDISLYWNKYEVPAEYERGRKVICGHTARRDGEIAEFGHTICIDTYAYGGQWLTCLNVETGEALQVNNQGVIRS